MNLLDCKVGARVTLYLNPDDNDVEMKVEDGIPPSQFDLNRCQQVIATLVYFDATDGEMPFICAIGADEERIGEGWYPIKYSKTLQDDIRNAGLQPEQFSYYTWLYHNTYIVPLNGVAVKGGMSCNKCHDHNEYATANQPNGEYRCYSCRS